MGIASAQTLGASVCVAGSSIRMIGVTSIAGLSRPLVKTMVAISVRTKTLGASGLIAHSSIGMVGQGRSVTGISRPLVKTMVAITIRAETLGASIRKNEDP